MRNKVIIIKGNQNLASKLTLGAYERICVDHIVLIVALKYPQVLPEKRDVIPNIYGNNNELNPNAVLQNTVPLMEYWHSHDFEYLLLGEYANIVLDQQIEQIKVIEGNALKTNWFYESVKQLHRNYAIKIVEVDILSSETVKFDEAIYPIEDFIEQFKPHPSLG